MWMKRRELIKIVILSMTILIAISSHWSITHYVKLYIDQLPYARSVWAEASVRAAYPAAVVLVVWILKTAR